MNKKTKISIIPMLFVLNSVTHAEQNFKHDSVIPPLKLGEYKQLNGCPAILKTEKKTEDNCPVDYTGNIEYERTLTADKILFGDNVTCEEGGTWSAWKEVKNNCVHIPPPTPNDLLKADNCNVIDVNGRTDDWYSFRRNPNQAFLKSNYDAAVASGMDAETFYSNLILDKSNKTYAEISTGNLLCNIQVTKNDASSKYIIQKASKAIDANSSYGFATMSAAKLNSFGLTSNNVIFNITNNNDNKRVDSVTINTNLVEPQSSVFNNVSKVAINGMTFNNATADFNYNNIDDLTISASSLTTRTLNFNGVNNLYVTNNTGINASNLNMNNTSLSPAGTIRIQVIKNLNILNNAVFDNYQSVSFDRSELKAGNLTFKNIKDTIILTGNSSYKSILTIGNSLTLDAVKNSFYMDKYTELKAARINVNNTSLIKNYGISKADSYITSDIYLDNTSNYDESLFGHLNGNIYGFKEPQLIDINSCNDVYVNGKNTQWKAFADYPKKAFLYDEYKSKFNIIEIRKNVLSNMNKLYGLNGDVECNANVMVQNETNKDVVIQNKDIVWSAAQTSDAFDNTKNTVNLTTNGNVNLILTNFGVYKGNITVENNSNLNDIVTIQNGTQNPVNIIGNVTVNGKYGLNQNVNIGAVISGRLGLSDITTFNSIAYRIYNRTIWNKFGDLSLKNVKNINLNTTIIDKEFIYKSDYQDDVTYINFGGSSILNNDVYLGYYAFYSKDTTVTGNGKIYEARIPKMLDADYCSDILVNGSNSDWKYFETNPNVAFNTKVYTTPLDSSKNEEFRTVLNNLTDKISFNNGAKKCLVSVPGYNVANQKTANYQNNNSKIDMTNGTAYTCGENGVFYINQLISNGSVTLQYCTMSGKLLQAESATLLINKIDVTNSPYYLENVVLNGTLRLKGVATNEGTTNTIKNVTAANIYFSSVVPQIENLTLNVFNQFATPKTIIDVTNAKANIKNTNVNYTLNGGVTSSYHLINIGNNGNLTLVNPLKLDATTNIPFVVNDKTNSTITGDIYLNSLSKFEKDASSKLFGTIYGGDKDYSSASQ